MNFLVKIIYFLSFIYFSHARDRGSCYNRKNGYFGNWRYIEDCPQNSNHGISNVKRREKLVCCTDNVVITSPPSRIIQESTRQIFQDRDRYRGSCYKNGYFGNWRYIEDCPQNSNLGNSNVNRREKLVCCRLNNVVITSPPSRIIQESTRQILQVTTMLPLPIVQLDTVVHPAKIRDISSPQISFECGIRSYEGGLRNYVVGGTVARNNSWPWMALLGNKGGINIKWFCAGALIHPQWVFTAAHCFLNLQSINDLVVRLGEHNYLSSGKESASVDYGAFEIVSHPQYKIGQGYYDAALIRLAQIVKFTEAILPVCLPWSTDIASENHVYETVAVGGWGAEKYEGLPSSVLRMVRITVFDSKFCHRSYSKLLDFGRSFPNGITNENMICAGNPGGGTAACQGDSGGPMVRGIEYPDKVFRYVAIGVVSRGHGCGLREFPGLYASVAASLDWIKQVAF